MDKKIVKLVGGLGNQMFQYAFAYALAKSFNINITLDMTWFEAVKNHENVTPRAFELDVFNINYEVATKEDLQKVIPTPHRKKPQRFLWKFFGNEKYKPAGNTYIQCSSYHFDKDLFVYPDYIYYDGYFQNEKYFKPVRKELLQCFRSNIALDEKNQQMLDKIIAENSISIHVRRGDYVTLECANDFHGTCSLEYYQKAIEYITKRVKNPHFFLFSDDIEWTIKNLKIEYPFTVVDFNQGKGWLDLNLMKSCKHNILANSSFSWWGAWLNENPNKIVIAPKKWTTQRTKGSIMPKEWIKL